MTRPYLECVHSLTQILKNEYQASVRSFREAPESEVLDAIPQEPGYCYPPRDIECSQSRPPFRTEFPEIKILLLKNQCVDINCSYPYDEKHNCIYVDPFFMQSAAYGDNSSGHLFAHGRCKAIVRRHFSPVVIDEGIFLGGNGSSNYYHWLIEIASKLQVLGRLSRTAKHFPLLVNKRLLEWPAYAEVIRILAPGQPLIWLSEGDSYLVRKVIFIEPFFSFPYNLRDGNRYAAGYFLARPEAIHYLREAVLPELGGMKAEPWPQRIYLPSTRRHHNQDELLAIAACAGFIVVRPEEHGFLKQAGFFAHARVIVGALGAAWANLAFASSSCRCLSWMPREKGEEAEYSNIAGILGIDLRYLVYPSGVRSIRAFYDHSYTLCPEAFRKALDSVL